MGEAFAVVLVRHEEVVTEVATFRKDGPYADGRRPDYVELDGATMEEDAARRDFTINGLFEDPDGEEASKVIDFHDGVADLKKHRVFGPLVIPRQGLRKTLHAAGRPVCGPLWFHIEAATKQAIVKHAPELGAVSRERVGGEVVMMLGHQARLRPRDAARVGIGCGHLGIGRTF